MRHGVDRRHVDNSQIHSAFVWNGFSSMAVGRDSCRARGSPAEIAVRIGLISPSATASFTDTKKIDQWTAGRSF